MSAVVNIASSTSSDDPHQALQQQVLLLNQRVRILEGECKELDKARTAEKAQRERFARSAAASASMPHNNAAQVFTAGWKDFRA
jgi:hypothetical protein